MDTHQIIIGLLTSIVVVLVVVICTRGQRIKELSGDVQSFRAQRDQFGTQNVELKRDYHDSVDKLTKKHDEDVERFDKEITNLHKMLKAYEKRDEQESGDFITF